MGFLGSFRGYIRVFFVVLVFFFSFFRSRRRSDKISSSSIRYMVFRVIIVS